MCFDGDDGTVGRRRRVDDDDDGQKCFSSIAMMAKNASRRSRSTRIENSGGPRLKKRRPSQDALQVPASSDEEDVLMVMMVLW